MASTAFWCGPADSDVSPELSFEHTQHALREIITLAPILVYLAINFSRHFLNIHALKTDI